MHVRPARVDEAVALTELAMRSKAHWGYDDAFMAACLDELTIRAEHIPGVDVAELDDQIVGMVRLEQGSSGPLSGKIGTVEDLFVEPAAIGTGVGRVLFRHAVRRAAAEGVARLSIDADPNAEGFYLSMGAVRVGESPSGSIPGRLLPHLELSVPSALVRFGYDDISVVYRGDDDVIDEYREWLDRMPLTPGAHVLDIGCGCGVPADRLLVARGCEVLGVDISDEQVRRARELVPEARFERVDIGDWDAPDLSFDAIVSFYALIHVPRDVLRELVPKLARWLRPGGHFLATVGAVDWTGVEDYLGSPMFWDTTEPATTIDWLEAAGFEIVEHHFVPEGDSGHELVHAVRR